MLTNRLITFLKDIKITLLDFYSKLTDYSLWYLYILLNFNKNFEMIKRIDDYK
jgi:hypothetical protein